MYELESEPDPEQIRKALIEYTKHATFPNIFIGTKHIGGYTDLKAIDDKGELESMIKGEKYKEPTKVTK